MKQKKRSKRYNNSIQSVIKTHIYSIEDAIALLKTIAEKNPTRFDQTFEIAVRLNIDPRQTDQMLRGTICLPAGTGKKRKILVITNDHAQQNEVKKQIDYVYGTEIIAEIQKGWLDFDVLITTPEIMPSLVKVARILGPKGLMPTPKLGTVVNDIVKAVNEFKKGKVEYRSDKGSNVHVALGKISFANEKIIENYFAVLNTLKKVKPAKVKGDYVKNITLSTTMGPGIKVAIQ